MAARRKNKVLDTEIVKLSRNMEFMTYELIDKWKKKYRYSIIEEFRKHVENLRESIICGLRCNKNNIQQKLNFYDLALCSLDNIEYLLEIMVSKRFCIISNSQYADFAILVDDIGNMTDRLIRSLTKGCCNENGNLSSRTAEFQSCDNESDRII
ncbi:MAG: four helix bundle protein [Bacteroidaceae bacterium]|nr:four helix bundle protein [Bacteroidaceae bacterium]